MVYSVDLVIIITFSLPGDCKPCQQKPEYKGSTTLSGTWHISFIFILGCFSLRWLRSRVSPFNPDRGFINLWRHHSLLCLPQSKANPLYFEPSLIFVKVFLRSQYCIVSNWGQFNFEWICIYRDIGGCNFTVDKYHVLYFRIFYSYHSIWLS